MTALCERAAAGVTVVVLARVRPAAMPALLALRRSGARVLGFPWLHAKAVLVDDRRGLVMSANLELHGLDAGFELGVALRDERAAVLGQLLAGWVEAAPFELALAPCLRDVPLVACALDLDDPTHHDAIYDVVRREVCPRLAGEVHVNVSPGTPAMHAVWLVLHAAGAFPANTRLWSSQLNPETKRTRLDPVRFAPSTYLREIRQGARAEPERARYEPEARSPARRAALDTLARYAAVAGAPLLILGERGTGKTRLVETLVATLKGRARVTTLACGGLDSTLADSLLFGHRRGAFTGADADRAGLLAEASGGVLFLDEVQDLPAPAQRKLVRVLQDRRCAFRPLGADAERTSDLELVCASNLPRDGLRARLDADLFDRISHLTVTLPPLRECREDLCEDWARAWRELRIDRGLPDEAPTSAELERLLQRHALPGNLRDLQRLAALLCAWWPGHTPDLAIDRALAEWQAAVEDQAPTVLGGVFGSGSRDERVRRFRAELAAWAKDRWGTWTAAAAALGCDEKTLREDARDGRPAARASDAARK